MTDASAADPDRVIDLFDEMAGLDPAERAARLDRLCRDDPRLCHELKELLAHHDGQAPEFLRTPPCPLDAAAAATGAEDVVGGRYRLGRVLGEGGMGVVHLAEQLEPVRRPVALKVIKLGMDTKQVVARFEAERQALAMMNHPNLANVLDGGSTRSGRPYFVMEFVDGLPITAHCDADRMTTRQRLELFLPVCEAVQHAHQKGIIHRDLKPSNVIVATDEGRSVPKVIDFGVAKAIDQRLTEMTIQTHQQQLVGTPAYMSPEQSELGGVNIDTRSDIYSLGVLLYELLTGTTPIDSETLRSASYDELRRLICDVESARPSSRIGALAAPTPTPADDDEAATTTAATITRHRRTDLWTLQRQLRGELDWIVMKAMEKDRERRYDSAAAMARDIEAHLRHEPVLAGPPSTVYRVRKFVRRHRILVAASMVVALVLVLATAISLDFAVVATGARNDAIRAQQNETRHRTFADQQAAARTWRTSAPRTRPCACTMSARPGDVFSPLTNHSATNGSGDTSSRGLTTASPS
ncbi:MAG: serine/threonine protein kinase [Planctomycetota bacterium]|jgi:serine/threonine protein kinase